jgi:ubiquinol-cytochrome c reductase cytochrome c1 subunit
MRLAVIAATVALLTAPACVSAYAQEETPTPPPQIWSFSGIFGTYDRAALQRGFQVYQQVCSTCHSMNQVSYRNLEAIGLTPGQVRAVAANVQIPTVNDQGQPTTRQGLPSDHFKDPYPNPQVAIATFGVVPPDQSVLVNAREDGSNYIYAILNGYRDPPAGFALPAGKFYNTYFPGHSIAMPPPLQNGQVTYADGTTASVPQMAHDVVTFLTWASNPEMEERKRMGVKITLFLLFMTGLTYAVKRKVWSDVEH